MTHPVVLTTGERVAVLVDRPGAALGVLLADVPPRAAGALVALRWDAAGAPCEAPDPEAVPGCPGRRLVVPVALVPVEVVTCPGPPVDAALYHVTTLAAWQSIQAEGFRPNDRRRRASHGLWRDNHAGRVFFTERRDAAGQVRRVGGAAVAVLRVPRHALPDVRPNPCTPTRLPGDWYYEFPDVRAAVLAAPVRDDGPAPLTCTPAYWRARGVMWRGE